ncbi:serine hydrolase domain-containing protein [Spirosoma montaniterrae]|uniref:Serine hydrolase n=1 Tax=Spirosoma montaniterrae TaxID=1178516 RepID=A0A1P9X130_9BACT|nr:serine hydrolase domain-containing protein [Spirosoma montaniterrae]AQG81341.1 serine hydrolase [Spirosoma montaniterrae]
MLFLLRCSLLIALFSHTLRAQTLHRLDGSRLSADSLDHRIKHLMQVANVSGVAISVFNRNKPVFSQTYGLADVPRSVSLTPESVMYAASFAKTVFAYIAMQLVQEGKLNLDQPLITYLNKPLPDYKIDGWNRGYQHLREDRRYEKITARMCLSHTTGFPNWRWFEPDKKLKIKFEPGTRYSYSGEGLYLLQFVLEQITGKGLETLAQERVFTPFGMKNTSFVWQKQFENAVCFGHNDAGKPYELMRWKESSAGGSMSTTLADFTAFYTALLRHTGLQTTTFREMIRPQIRIRSRRQFGPMAWVDSTDNDAIALSYGLGVGVLQTPYGPAFFKEGHDEGWGHYSIAFPDKKIAIVIMTNNDNGERIFKELLAYSIGDTFTPWQWEAYIPYDAKL